MYVESGPELMVTPDVVEEACLDPVAVGSARIRQLLSKLDNDMLDIRNQIDIAARRLREDGIKSDEGWFRSAQKALRIKQTQHDKLNRALYDARTAENARPIITSASTPEQYDIRIAFYHAAREILHEEDFRDIMATAQQAISKREVTFA